jgi:hypothetical protein
MSQSQQSRGDDEDEDMHETTREEVKIEESTRDDSPPPQQTPPLSFSIMNSPSASDILRPLSMVAAQRSFHLPTSGSLAFLARGHQHDHADGRQIGRDYESTTHSSIGSSSWIPERLLQSDSILDATTTTDLEDVGTSTSSAAVRDFMAMVWESSTETTATTTTTAEIKPVQHTVSAYSSSPLSSPGSSLVEGSSGPFEEEEEEEEEEIMLSPFASIFPDGTNTITPLFIQRYDDDNNVTADADQRTILKYSESIQLFRRSAEDGGKTWKRRVFEYR